MVVGFYSLTVKFSYSNLLCQISPPGLAATETISFFISLSQHVKSSLTYCSRSKNFSILGWGQMARHNVMQDSEYCCYFYLKWKQTTFQHPPPPSVVLLLAPLSQRQMDLNSEQPETLIFCLCSATLLPRATWLPSNARINRKNLTSNENSLLQYVVTAG